MRGGFRGAALLAALLLFGAACTLTGTSQTAQGTPSQETTPSSSPSGNATSTPSGTTETPTSSPSSAATPPSSTAPPPTKLIILNFSMHIGEVGVAYGPVTVGGAGGTPPYHWSIGGGALPGGMSISSGGGTISGTPGASGNFTFVVLLQDSGGQSAGVSRPVTVLPHLSTSGFCTVQCAVEQGCINVCGAYTDVAGGVTPYTFALTGGTLPAGTAINGTSLAGTFTTVQPATAFTVKVTDAFGASSTVNSVFMVFSHIAFTVTTATCGNSPNNCNSLSFPPLRIPYSGGAPGGTPTVKVMTVGPANAFFKTAQLSVPGPTSGTCSTPVTNATSSPPPGMAVSASGGVMTLAAGPPDGTTWCSYSAMITFILIDSSPCGPAPGTMCTTTNMLSVVFFL